MKKFFKVFLKILITLVLITGLCALGIYIFSIVKDLTFIDAVKQIFLIKK